MKRDVEPARPAAAATLAGFFADVSPRLLADVRAAGVLAGADEAGAQHEWHAVALHACIRGVVSDGGHGDETADLVDAFHDLVLAQLAPERDWPVLRAQLAARYGEYDGITRTLGKDGAPRVPGMIAAACARHVRPSDRAALSETLTPLLEALAEGAAAALSDGGSTAPVADLTSPATVPADVTVLRLPPVEPLRDLMSRLDATGFTWGVGASGLLASLGLVSEVNDWDIQVEAPPEQLQWLFSSVPHTFHGHGGCHADWKLAFEAQRTELITRFAFYAPDVIVNVPLRVSGEWQGLPIASPEGWACAYWLMGQFDAPSLRVRRAERAELLFTWLAEHGADATRVEELLAEPVPESLAQKLAALRRA